MSDLTTISHQLDDVLAQIAAQREELARREAAMAAQAEQLSRDAATQREELARREAAMAAMAEQFNQDIAARAAYAQGRYDGISACCQVVHLRMHELPRSNARTVGRSLLADLEALRDAA